MLVPRSFKYSSSPPKQPTQGPPNNGKLSSHPQATATMRTMTTRSQSARVPREAQHNTHHSTLNEPTMPQRTTSDSIFHTPSKPVSIPKRSPTSETTSIQSSRARGQHQAQRKPRASGDAHKPDALPPAVAALLAVTAIPPPKPSQLRRNRSSKTSSRRISIDQLVQEWRSEDSFRSSFGSHASLELLLESADESTGEYGTSEEPMGSRSTSSDSIPSLEADDRSLLSFTDPATPEDLRTHRKPSSINSSSRKTKSRSLPETEDCVLDHPLIPSHLDSDDSVPTTPTPLATQKPHRRRSILKSNLTTSLHALKTRALSSLSSLTDLASNPALQQSPASSSSSPHFSDETLWAHPFLFPRFSPEVRPSYSGTPTESQRRYLNPTPLPLPLSREEQQIHASAALHDTLFDGVDEAPMIQMQTYSRRTNSSSRSSSRGKKGPDPRSEAGRVLSVGGAEKARQREPRENSDFLRVVVLEMNMRRRGKLEDGVAGRARIALPPRRTVAQTSSRVLVDEDGDELEVDADAVVAERVPRRWVGVSA